MRIAITGAVETISNEVYYTDLLLTFDSATVQSNAAVNLLMLKLAPIMIDAFKFDLILTISKGNYLKQINLKN